MVDNLKNGTTNYYYVKPLNLSEMTTTVDHHYNMHYKQWQFKQQFKFYFANTTESANRSKEGSVLTVNKISLLDFSLRIPEMGD